MKNKFKKLLATDIRKVLSIAVKSRTVCKFCLSYPTNYYYSKNAFNYKSPRDTDLFYKNVCKNTTRFHKELLPLDAYFSPSSYKDTYSFRYKLNYKSFAVRQHKNIYHNNHTYLTEYLSCKCGKSYWAFNRSLIDGRPDIVCRKR